MTFLMSHFQTTFSSTSQSESNSALNQTQKFLIFNDSIKFKSRLMRMDLNKIQINFCKKISRVYNRLKFDLPIQSANNLKTKSNINTAGGEINPGQKISNKKDPDKRDKWQTIIQKLHRKSLLKHGYEPVQNQWFLAEGAYGTVYCVQKNGVKFACKVISNAKLMKDENNSINNVKIRSRFYNEVRIMRMVQGHPNIISLCHFFEEELSTNQLNVKNKRNSTSKLNGINLLDKICDNDKVQQQNNDQQKPSLSLEKFINCFLIMEYANSKTLSYFLKKDCKLPECITKEIFVDIIDAVRYLHLKQIAHRDIKLSNILLHRKRPDNLKKNYKDSGFAYHVKLCDFGLSSIVEQNDDDDAVGCFLKPIGTTYYMAPEILRAYYFYFQKNINMIVPYCAYKGDIWALGVCIFFCLHGFYPLNLLCYETKQQRIDSLKKIFTIDNCFTEDDYVQAYCRNIQNELHDYHCHLSSACKELLRKMLSVLPKNRPKIEAILQHRFFSKNVFYPKDA